MKQRSVVHLSGGSVGRGDFPPDREAVDQHGNVLDVLVQSRRNAVAANRFFCKLLKGLR